MCGLPCVLQAGRLLRLFPALRLAVGGYALLLHIWLFVLLMHMAPEAGRRGEDRHRTPGVVTH